MREVYLGFDTSNYTTSIAAYDACCGEVLMQKQLLRVKPGERGLRQSEAVFQHTLALPELAQALFAELVDFTIVAVGASARPRDTEGSYMPCFLTGLGTARVIAAAEKVPLYETTHQAGHILAALYSANKLPLLGAPFFAFHVSGGTTEALLVTPDEEKLLRTEIVAETLDLNAGQVIDRVGVALGLMFPAGAALEGLAAQSMREFRVKPVLKGSDCCLSGLENLCKKHMDAGESPADVAKFCMETLARTLEEMAESLLARYGALPLLFSGGVMSNRMLRERLIKRFGAYFAEPRYSADNAAGAALYAYLKANQRKNQLQEIQKD